MVLQLLRSHTNERAWVVMITMVWIHVCEEALTGFLPFYNRVVETLQGQVGFFPMPTFSFGPWLGGLLLAVALCYALTPLVARGGRTIRAVTTVLGVLMVGNALGHLVGSAYLGRVLPGMWTSPLLLIAAIYVVVRGTRGDWGRAGNRVANR